MTKSNTEPGEPDADAASEPASPAPTDERVPGSDAPAETPRVAPPPNAPDDAEPTDGTASDETEAGGEPEAEKTAEEAEVTDEEAARASLAKVFEVLDVAKVVYVDDWFGLQEQEEEAAQDKIVGWLSALPEDGRRAASADLMPDVPFDADVQVWRQPVVRQWRAMGAGDRRKLQKRLIQLLGLGDYDKDEGAVSVLRTVLPSAMDDPLEISPDEWERAEAVLTEATPQARVLCLLDRNFDYTYGLGSERDGVALLRDVVGDYDRDSVIFGLFSHTFEPNDELLKWRELVDKHDELDQDNFLPLSKSRQDDLVLLAKGLEMMSLNLPCAAMKRMALDALASAHDAAAADVQSLEVYDFDEMVLRSSLREGVWEGDTLLRLYQVFHRDAVRQKMLGTDGSATRFNDAVELGRAISAHKVGTDVHPPNQRWTIRHQELFQDGHVLNPQHAPLRTGDVFTTQGGRLYVLIAQPCDIMVRAEGPGSGERSSSVVSLVPIKPSSKEEWDKMPIGKKRVCMAMPYLSGDSSDVGVVLFKSAEFVHPDVLDLAVLHPEGYCRIDLNDALAPAAQMNAAWKKRHGRLVKLFGKHRNKLDELWESLQDVPEKGGARRKAWEAVMPSFSMGQRSPFPTAPYGEGVFDFGLQRTAHYREPNASRLLAAYSRFLSRDALPHDFALEQIAS